MDVCFLNNILHALMERLLSWLYKIINSQAGLIKAYGYGAYSIYCHVTCVLNNQTADLNT